MTVMNLETSLIDRGKEKLFQTIYTHTHTNKPTFKIPQKICNSQIQLKYPYFFSSLLQHFFWKEVAVKVSLLDQDLNKQLNFSIDFKIKRPNFQKKI